MADFEGLIRQALARHNAADPAVRQKVYQSSRNALARMIVAGGAQSPTVIQEQREALENSIKRVEAGYGKPAASQDAVPPPAASPEPVVESPAKDAAQAQNGSEPEVVPTPEFPEEDHPIYENPSSGRGRMIAITAFVVLLAVIGWLVYSLVTTILGPTQNAQVQQNLSSDSSDDPSAGDGNQTGDYITILSPADTGTLQLAGRGRAEIVSEANEDMIRLTSLRDANDRSTSAEPILLEITDGVLNEIAGRRVTVEIMAKSGSTGPAVFAIGCIVAGVDSCGRRRLRIGLQPEAIVFPLEIPGDAVGDAGTYLTMNTDITSSAALTGEGDSVDLLYARVRLQDR